MLHIHAWSVCKLRSEFICCFSFQGHVSSLQRILHKMGGKWDFSGIGYDFSQQREYKCSTWAIKNSTGAKNSPWITSFCFRQWAHSLAASAMQTGHFAAILPLVPIPSGSSPPWPSPPKDWGTCSLPAPASARPPLAPAPHHSPSGNPSGLSFWGFCEKRPRIIASSPEVLSPHKGVMASSPPRALGGAAVPTLRCQASDWIRGACFLLLPMFTEVEGLSCPKRAKRPHKGADAIPPAVRRGEALAMAAPLWRGRWHKAGAFPPPRWRPVSPSSRNNRTLWVTSSPQPRLAGWVSCGGRQWPCCQGGRQGEGLWGSSAFVVWGSSCSALRASPCHGVVFGG